MSRSDLYSVVLSFVISTSFPNSPGTRKSPVIPSPKRLTSARMMVSFQMRP